MKKALAMAMVLSFMVVTITASAVLAKDLKAEQILWQHAGNLEPAIGMDKNIGYAGMLSGMANGYIIVGGGANFPNGGPAVGGPKKTYPDVYAFKVQNGKLLQTDHTKLPFEIAYGASVTTAAGVYYIGGSTDPEGAKAISLLTVDQQGTIHNQKVGELPFALQNGVAAFAKDKLYIGLGKQAGKASNKFYEYNLKTQELKELTDFPGEAREQSVAQILNGKLYVFSGGNKIAYTDGYAYDIASGVWQQAADVKIGDQAISLLGANSVKLNADEMLVIGGFNKAVYDNAVAQLSSLTGDALTAFKEQYFVKSNPRDFQWNTQILIYRASTNTWRSIGEVPFDAPCGAGLVLADDMIVSVNGEIKPGIRSERMYTGIIKAKS